MFVECIKSVVDELYEDGRLAFVEDKTYDIVEDLKCLYAINEQGVHNVISEDENQIWNNDKWFGEHFILVIGQQL